MRMDGSLALFNDQLHEDLFVMFILKANSPRAYEVCAEGIELRTSAYCFLVDRDYDLMFTDRTIHQEEHEGYVSDGTVELLHRPSFHMYRAGELHFLPTIYQKNKIKFHFCEDE